MAKKKNPHLKTTAGPGRPKMTPQEKEGRKLAKKLVSDPRYVRELQNRLREGRCQPGVEVALWHYAHGKPPDVIETKLPVAVRIVNQFSGDDDLK
jgi:hypothetical protein